MDTPPPAAAPALGRCLVTGGTGFLGAALARHLGTLGLPVRTLSRRDAAGDHVAADLAVAPPPAAAWDGVRTVFHLAALTHAEANAASPAAFEALNVEGTRRVVAGALEHGVERLVLVSSAKALGEGGPRRIADDAIPSPTTPYGRSKLAAEGVVLAAADRLQVGCLRLPLVYGPGQRGNLARLIAAIEAGWLPPPPHAANRRSVVHRDDASRALVAVAGDPRAAGRTYLLAEPQPYSTRQIHDWVRSAMGRRPARWSAPLALFRAAALAGDVTAFVLRARAPFDSAAFEKLLGSAWYAGDAIANELGVVPRESLRETIPFLLGRQAAASRRLPPADASSP